VKHEVADSYSKGTTAKSSASFAMREKDAGATQDTCHDSGSIVKVDGVTRPSYLRNTSLDLLAAHEVKMRQAYSYIDHKCRPLTSHMSSEEFV